MASSVLVTDLSGIGQDGSVRCKIYRYRNGEVKFAPIRGNGRYIPDQGLSSLKDITDFSTQIAMAATEPELTMLMV